MKRVCDILANKQYRAEAGRLPGIDVTPAGTLLSLSEAFPELRAASEAQDTPALRRAD
jgi:hypothetical protein